MPDLDLAVATSCYGFIRDELAGYGLEPPADTMTKLEITAGKDSKGSKVYRPHGLIGTFLDRAINSAHPISGKAGVLRNPDLAVAAWFSDQRNLDAALGLTVPPVPASGRLSKGSFIVRTRTTYE